MIENNTKENAYPPKPSDRKCNKVSQQAIRIKLVLRWRRENRERREVKSHARTSFYTCS
jgi:hypothetical protein